MEDKKYCKFCGEQIDKTSVVCPKCGRQIKKTVAVKKIQKSLKQTKFWSLAEWQKGYKQINEYS